MIALILHLLEKSMTIFEVAGVDFNYSNGSPEVCDSPCWSCFIRHWVHYTEEKRRSGFWVSTHWLYWSRRQKWSKTRKIRQITAAKYWIKEKLIAKYKSKQNQLQELNIYYLQDQIRLNQSCLTTIHHKSDLIFDLKKIR